MGGSCHTTYYCCCCIIALVIPHFVCVSDLVDCCSTLDMIYPTTLSAGNFSYSIITSQHVYGEQAAHILLTSPGTEFVLALTSCRLVVAHNDDTIGVQQYTTVWHVDFATCSSTAPHVQVTISFLPHGDLVVLLSHEVSAIENIPYEETEQVWNTNTGGKGVEALRLNENGNLVLYNARRMPIWESFEHPSSVVLSSQALRQGMSVSLLHGLFNISLVIEPSRAVLYAIHPSIEEPTPYWELLPNSPPNAIVAYAAVGNCMGPSCLQLFDSNHTPLVAYGPRKDTRSNAQNGRKLFVDSDGNGRRSERGTLQEPSERNNGSTSKLWRTEITSVGNLETYEWRKGMGWKLKEEAVKNACELPGACKRYNTCNTKESEVICKCEEPLVEREGECEVPRNVGLVSENWCTTTRSSSRSSSLSFIELTNTSVYYFAIKVGDGGNYNASFTECQSFCLHNCSCFAFIFHKISLSCIPILHPHSHDPSTPSTLNFLGDTHSSLFIKLEMSSISSPSRGMNMVWIFTLCSLILLGDWKNH